MASIIKNNSKFPASPETEETKWGESSEPKANDMREGTHPLSHSGFAVIEYSSKSGDIWYHTPKKPNYLANPQTEIDATSFGCYVSAMAGRHIPITKIVSASKLTNRVYRKITGHWPTNYSLEEFKDLDAVLMVYDMGNGPHITAFTKQLKQAYPDMVVIGVPTQPYGLLKDYWQSNPASHADAIQFMNSCDRFLTIVASTKEYWQSLTTTPVVYAPQPYPANHATKSFRPLAEKKSIIFVAGVTNRFDIKRGHLVAKQVQQQLPDYTIHVTQIPGHDLDLSNLAGTTHEVQPFELWQEHLSYLSQASLVINTDYTSTRGRVQTDCAAVGTPSIGADSDGQVDLFPKYPATAQSSVEALANQAVELLTNQEKYQSTVSFANQALEKYSYKESALRLQAIISHTKATSA